MPKIWLQGQFRPYVGDTYNAHSSRPYRDYPIESHERCVKEIYDRFFSHLDDLYPSVDSIIRIYGVDVGDVYDAIHEAKECIYDEHFDYSEASPYDIIYQMGADWLKIRMDMGYQVHGFYPEGILEHLKDEE